MAFTKRKFPTNYVKPEEKSLIFQYSIQRKIRKKGLVYMNTWKLSKNAANFIY